jgi:hypothetical protein
MAFREVRVFEVREVLRLWLAGEGIRATERQVGFDRKTARSVPARVPLRELHPDAAVHDGERKRLHDAIRMATYNAETALARLLAPLRPRRGRSPQPAREALRSPADLHIVATSSTSASTRFPLPAAPGPSPGSATTSTPPPPSTPGHSSPSTTASRNPEPLRNHCA